MRLIRLGSLLGLVLFSSESFAYLENSKLPVCLDEKKKEIAVDNQQVLYWKFNTKNQFQARGYVAGQVKEEPRKVGDHYHFIISIGSGEKDTVEIIYNVKFGRMPQVRVGDEITVCGDYITSYARSGRYQPSPAGALIHWVHYNPGNRELNHPHGFIAFGTTLVGFDMAPDVAWSGDVVKGPDPTEDGKREDPAPRPDQPLPRRPKVEAPRRSEMPSEPEPKRPTVPSEEKRKKGSGRSEAEDNLPEICKSVRGRCQ